MLGKYLGSWLHEQALVRSYASFSPCMNYAAIFWVPVGGYASYAVV